MTMPYEQVKLQDRLFALRKEFVGAGIETAELDARLLMQAATGFDHAELILNNNRLLKQSEITAINVMAQRRSNHEPVSRILGVREFYGRPFQISSDVLDPRADTETLINQALTVFANNQPSDRQLDILDIGTGSGAIIITLLCEVANARGIATDISAKALGMAHKNGIDLGVDSRLSLLETQWCAGIKQKFNLIVSNPPYITTRDVENLPVDVKGYDPHIALDGGKDGLAAYRVIANQSVDLLKPQGTIILEIGFDQAGDVVKIFKSAGFIEHPSAATISKDLGDNDRIVTMLWGE